MKSKEVRKRFKWCWNSFCVTFLYRKYLVRDLVILSLLVISLGAVLTTGWYIGQKIQNERLKQSAVPEEKEPTEQEAVQNEEKSVADIQSRFDTSSWTPYQNTWYGLALKYPDGWADPVVQKPNTGSIWEQKIRFSPGQTDEKNPFDGFDVTVYNVSKAKELADTYEFPKLKNEELSSEEKCINVEGHLLETGDYPAEEIYIPANDACYNATLFFTNTRDNYIYTIVPEIKDGSGLAGDPAKEIRNHIPEFFSVASTWRLIDIRRPKPIVKKPKSNAPMPVSHIVVDGRKVCAKKNDHPGKSNQSKGKHLDMECCLDPDEYPNPHCYYSEDKYGKYL